MRVEILIIESNNRWQEMKNRRFATACKEISGQAFPLF